MGRTKRKPNGPKKTTKRQGLSKNRPLTSRTTTASQLAADKVKKNYEKRRRITSKAPTGTHAAGQPGPSSANPRVPIPMAAQAQWNEDDFDEITEMMGADGGYSNIYTAYSKSKKKTCVLKQLIDDLEVGPGEVVREHDLQMRAVHENIVRHWGSYVSENHHVFVMDYFARGDLHDVIFKDENKHLLVEPKIKLFLRQIVSGAHYIQSKLRHIHKDLKPENIFLANDNCVKISDFGSAIPIRSLRFLHDSGKEPIGTIQYLASEDMENHKFDSTADVWAIGIIAYELLVQNKPFMTDAEDGIDKMLPRIKAFEDRVMQLEGFARFERNNPLAYKFVQKLLSPRLRRPVLSAVARLDWLKE